MTIKVCLSDEMEEKVSFDHDGMKIDMGVTFHPDGRMDRMELSPDLFTYDLRGTPHGEMIQSILKGERIESWKYGCTEESFLCRNALGEYQRQAEGWYRTSWKNRYKKCPEEHRVALDRLIIEHLPSRVNSLSLWKNYSKESDE